MGTYTASKFRERFKHGDVVEAIRHKLTGGLHSCDTRPNNRHTNRLRGWHRQARVFCQTNLLEFVTCLHSDLATALQVHAMPCHPCFYQYGLRLGPGRLYPGVYRLYRYREAKGLYAKAQQSSKIRWSLPLEVAYFGSVTFENHARMSFSQRAHIEKTQYLHLHAHMYSVMCCTRKIRPLKCKTPVTNQPACRCYRLGREARYV